MATNQFLVFAIGGGAFVMSQADYDALAARSTGFNSGTAIKEQLNKVWRQSAFVSSSLAQFMADRTGDDVLDDGDQDAFIAILLAALAQNAPAPTVLTTGGAYTALPTDRDIVVNQAVGAAKTINLPADPVDGYQLTVIDGKGDCAINNITVSGNGNTINGENNIVMAQAWQALTFIWNGTQFNIKGS